MASFAMLLAQAGAAAPPLEFYQEGWFRTVVALLIIAGSWGLGKWLSRVWRMPDYSFRFGLILFSIIAGAVICVWSWPPKRGIDLKGGVILIYEVAEEQQSTLNLAEPLDRVRNYLDRLNVETQVAARSGNQIVVSAATKDDEQLAQIEETVTGIRFRDLKITPEGREPKNERTAVVFTVTSTTAAATVNMDDLVAALNRRINPGGQKEVVVRKFGERQVEIIIPEVDPNEIDLIKQKISTAGLLEFRIVANNHDHLNAIELARANPLAKEIAGEGGRPIAKWVKLDPREKAKLPPGLEMRPAQDGETEILVVMDPYDVTGGFLSNATTGHDEYGRPCVNFTFNSAGAVRFGNLTGENTPDLAQKFHRQLGIILDGQLVSAPNLESAISSQGRITGSFTQDEVKFIVEILNAGRLPAALDKAPVSQTSISPQLGADTIRNGSIAMIISTLAILVFMAMYYRFSGLVADLAVVVNLLLVVALMITLGAAFTLAGLAGLVLSVGMAVDANVLIYERMREELQRGSALRMAIRNGFGRAMSTIIDSNLTTLLTGVVLYAIGTDQLKGFAITLILGLLLNLYTAVYMARVIFDVAERRRWITQLKMMRMFETPGWDFVRPTKYAITVSLLVIVGGLIGAASRGEGLFGIDFTGGTSVQIVLAKGHEMSVGEIRDIVNPDDATLPHLEDVTVSTVGQPDAEGKSRIYKIDTSNRDITEVEDRLKEMLGERLQVYRMRYEGLDQTPGGGTRAADAASAATREGTALPAKEQSEKAAPTQQSGEEQKSAKETATDSDTNTRDSGDKDSDESSGKEKKSDGGDPQAGGASPSLRALGAVTPFSLALVQDDGKSKTDSAADEPEVKKEATGNGEEKSNSDNEAKSAKSDQPPADSKTADSKTADDKAADDKANKAAGEKAAGKKAADADASDKTDSATEKQATSETKSEKGSTKGAAERTVPAAERAMPPAERVGKQLGFPGGSSVELRFEQAIGESALAGALEAAAKTLKLEPAQFQFEERKDTQDEINTRLYNGWKVYSSLPAEQLQQVLDSVKAELSQTPVFLAANNIGGKVASHAQIMAIYAVLASMVMIVVYVWVRFQNIVFGLAAVVALVHDVLVTVAALGVSYYVADYLGWAMVDPFKISLDVVAALLTIVGFSINDTIVIFDRIREIKGKSPEVNADMVNRAVNQTMGRTILTSGTVLIVTIILYIWGGQEIHPFSFAMLVGLISGTYSTIYIASPLVLFLRKPGAARRQASPRGTELAMRA